MHSLLPSSKKEPGEPVHIAAAEAIAAVPRISGYAVVKKTAEAFPPLFLHLKLTAMSTIMLSELMQYRNEDVLSRFTDLMDVTDEEAEDIFAETKKFLFICRQPGVFIPDELLIVDEMWHNFILFTKEYQDFCAFYFGGYLHHTPATRAAKTQHREELAADAATVKNAFNEKLARLMS